MRNALSPQTDDTTDKREARIILKYSRLSPFYFGCAGIPGVGYHCLGGDELGFYVPVAASLLFLVLLLESRAPQA